MSRTTLLGLLVVVATVPGCKAATPPAQEAKVELATEEDKTMYALGLALSERIAGFELSEAELGRVIMGLRDGVLKKEAKVDANTYRPKIQEAAMNRAKAAADREKKAATAFQDKVAAEKGATRTDSGLIIVPIQEGTGTQPTAADQVKVHYVGTLTDGTVFDSSVERGEPVTFPLSGVIPCWQQGLPMMKVGGKSKLVCPSDLAYGDRGQPPKIKPGATLVFEVELLEIVKQP